MFTKLNIHQRTKASCEFAIDNYILAFVNLSHALFKGVLTVLRGFLTGLRGVLIFSTMTTRFLEHALHFITHFYSIIIHDKYFSKFFCKENQP